MRLLPATILFVACLFANRANAELPPQFIDSWGALGSGPGQFNTPYGVATDAAGNVFTTEYDNLRVQKFDPGGRYLTSWSTTVNGERFGCLGGLAVDRAGSVYVVEVGNGCGGKNRVSRFSNSGTFMTSWGGSGSGPGQFGNSTAVAVDNSGYVYVLDSGQRKVKKFTADGVYVLEWGSQGVGDGQFYLPAMIAVDQHDFVFVTDYGLGRIQKFTGEGAFLARIADRGVGDGQFQNPFGIAVDPMGNLYVTDMSDQTASVQKITSSGVFLCKWGRFGIDVGQFNSLQGVAVDSDGRVYVADAGNNRIQVFGPAPTPVRPSSWSQIKAAFPR